MKRYLFQETRNVLVVLCLLLTGVFVNAATPPPVRLQLTQTDVQPVALESVRVATEIEGGTAVTEVELLFHNPNSRILEGELQFPLLDNQDVIGLALDIGGKMRRAVAVDKARGRQVFEDIVRRSADPALLENTQGHAYRLRVYPIPAKGTRRVMIRLREILDVWRDHRVYRLPLAFGTDQPSLQLQITVRRPPRAPDADTAMLGDVVFKPYGTDYRLDVRRDQFKAQKYFEVRVSADTKTRVMVRKHDVGQNAENYFTAEIPMPDPASVPRSPPRHVTLLWDASNSGDHRDPTRELELLDAYFKWMKQGEITLLRLRNTAEAPIQFSLKQGQWDALRTALRETVYDGATCLGCFKPHPQSEEYLLFSDGVDTLGSTPLPKLDRPLFAISSVPGADGRRLAHLAEPTGGRFIDLTRLSGKAATAALTTQEEHLLAMDADDGVKELVAPSRYPVAGRLWVAGKLTHRDAHVDLTLGRITGAKRKIRVTIANGDVLPEEGAPLWAQWRIAELGVEPRVHQAEIKRIAQTFNLPSRETSLLVLESAEDYARYNVMAPTELKAEVEQIQTTQAKHKTSTDIGHIEDVVRRFEDQQKWWKTDFPKGKPQPKKMVANSLQQSGLVERGRRSQSSWLSPRLLGAERAHRVPLLVSPAQTTGVRDVSVAATAPPDTTKGASGESSTVVMVVRPWSPQATYATRFQDAKDDELYRTYLDERADYANSPAFYLIAADALMAHGKGDLALRVLSNLAEMDLENRHLLRVLALRLIQMQRVDLALTVLNQVCELAEHEPQSWRDLGLAQASAGQTQQAINTLYKVVSGNWDSRFGDIDLITLADLNALIQSRKEPLDTSPMDARLLRNLPLDVRVVLAWDADNTDIDLEVTDPNGEITYYRAPLSYQGGRLSKDVTGGYGPEEYALKLAKPGKYTIKARFYGDERQNLTGPIHVNVKFFTHFGTPNQNEKTAIMQIDHTGESFVVGEFDVKE